MRLFWFILIYSYLGFWLETLYARLMGNSHKSRKCLLLLPLCPVYGFGAAAISLLPEWVMSCPALLMLLGGGIATAVEYAAGWFYERLWGVSFWDYSALPCHLHGRVCLPFSLCWCALTPLLVYGVHPWVTLLSDALPETALVWCAALFLSDSLVSGFALRRLEEKNSPQKGA